MYLSRSIYRALKRTLSVALLIFTISSAEAEENIKLELPIYATKAELGYQSMLNSLGPKLVYLLGDASHGTEEFYAFRREITQSLIKEHRLRVIIIEEEWDSVEIINDYILGNGYASLETRELLDLALPRWPKWIWNNRQMVKFIDWVKDWNQNHTGDEQVRMLGMDMKEAILPSIERLSTLWTESLTTRQELIRLSDYWKLIFQYATGGLEYSEQSADVHRLIAQSLKRLRDLKEDTDPLLDMLDFANRYYQHYQSNFFEAWNIRSRYMAKFVHATIYREAGGGSVAVWAHNNHVGDKSADDVKGSGLINMGQLLREKIGANNIFILGSAGYQGAVLAARQWQNDGEVQPVSPARDHSIEQILFHSPWENPLLYWDTPINKERWNFDVLHRGIGAIFDHTKDDAETWSITNIARRYDALVFWRTTTSLK